MYSPPKIKTFLKYIKEEIYKKLLHQRFNYSVFDKRHSQLWFLPTPAGCRAETKKIFKAGDFVSIGEEEYLGNIIDEYDKNNWNVGFKGVKNAKQQATNTIPRESSNKKIKKSDIYSVPPGNKIEHVTRNLAEIMMTDPYFKKHFCILIIHGQKNQLPQNYIKKTVSDGNCISTLCVDPKGNIGKCIEKEEACAVKKGKSLIILTGMKLRLGISLKCVDIALHLSLIHI